MTASAVRASPGPAEAGLTSLPARLADRAARTPHDLALRKKELGRWKLYDWIAYATRTARIAAGFEALGVGPGDRVGIVAENRPAWLFADVAAQSLGAVSVAVDPGAEADEVADVLAGAGCVVLVADDEEQVDKVVGARDRLSELRRVVVVDDRGVDVDADPWLLRLADLEAFGASAGPNDLAARAVAIDPASTALVVHWAGRPDAEVTHAELVAQTRAADAPPVGPSDEVLSYLPLALLPERQVSLVDALDIGYVVNFGEGGESLTSDRREVQPTVLLGVPMVWEQLRLGVEERMVGASRLKRSTYRAWMARGASRADRRPRDHAGTQRPRRGLGWLVLYRPLRRKLGLGRLRDAISTGGEPSAETVRFLAALGITLRPLEGES